MSSQRKLSRRARRHAPPPSAAPAPVLSAATAPLNQTPTPTALSLPSTSSAQAAYAYAPTQSQPNPFAPPVPRRRTLSRSRQRVYNVNQQQSPPDMDMDMQSQGRAPAPAPTGRLPQIQTAPFTMSEMAQIQTPPNHTSQRRPTRSTTTSTTMTVVTPSSSRTRAESTSTPGTSQLRPQPLPNPHPHPAIAYPTLTSPGLPPTEPLLHRSPPSQSSSASVSVSSARATASAASVSVSTSVMGTMHENGLTSTPKVPANGIANGNTPAPSDSRSALNVFMAQESGQYGPYSYESVGKRSSRPPSEFYPSIPFPTSTSAPPSSNQHSLRSTSTPAHISTPARTPLPFPAHLTREQYTYLETDEDYPSSPSHPSIRTSFSFLECLASPRAWSTLFPLILLFIALLMLFLGYPLLQFFLSSPSPLAPIPGFNFGGRNGSGQVPELVGLPGLVDGDTPQGAMSRIGADGSTWRLVFSDEFEKDGRTFWPGDDPYWEAVDLNYWPTGDLEWYNPQAVVTQGGSMVITMSEMQNHDLNFQSGMVTSWNKVCFTTAYIEVRVSLPGAGNVPGLWPGVWTMGNLGRAGYGASTEGTWPYSYAACDLGTFPLQLTKDGEPASSQDLSGLPRQKLSACTCPGGDHPGPNVATGRGAPEIDVIEAQVDVVRGQGEVSQSMQVAPFNANRQFVNSTPSTTIVDDSITHLNSFVGTELQQSLSAVTLVDNTDYNGNGFATYGVEFWSDPDDRDGGYVVWYVNGKETWRVEASAIGPDTVSMVSQRLISEEPMYLIFNLGMSPSFQKQDFKHLQFPSKMFIDYIRVYQRPDVKDGVTCDPASHPTKDYINSHMEAYTNPNLTTWASAGFGFPANSRYDGC